MSLDTDIPHQQQGAEERDCVERFMQLVKDGKKPEALRVYREEYSLEQQERIRREAEGYFRAAKIQF